MLHSFISERLTDIILELAYILLLCLVFCFVFAPPQRKFDGGIQDSSDGELVGWLMRL